MNVLPFTTHQRSNPNISEDGPSAVELDAIEIELPVIEAEVELLDAYIATLDRIPSQLDARRIRRARNKVLAARRELANSPGSDEVA
ncbi:DUF6284 family protein [Streptomyces sp. ODS28]|uniref:DUF6284 family protein n=1 Tax=Streptomyces sp. ODS28 TaxID=3136688 RepID=UPI0031F0A203